jgi:hypothetical protein
MSNVDVIATISSKYRKNIMYSYYPLGGLEIYAIQRRGNYLFRP